jgi:hypothetical protein
MMPQPPRALRTRTPLELQTVRMRRIRTKHADRSVREEFGSETASQCPVVAFVPARCNKPDGVCCDDLGGPISSVRVDHPASRISGTQRFLSGCKVSIRSKTGSTTSIAAPMTASRPALSACRRSASVNVGRITAANRCMTSGSSSSSVRSGLGLSNDRRSAATSFSDGRRAGSFCVQAAMSWSRRVARGCGV